MSLTGNPTSSNAFDSVFNLKPKLRLSIWNTEATNRFIAQVKTLRFKFHNSSSRDLLAPHPLRAQRKPVPAFRARSNFISNTTFLKSLIIFLFQRNWPSNMALLQSCWCFSLKTGSIIICALTMVSVFPLKIMQIFFSSSVIIRLLRLPH